jgi:indoleamine 2,3-dioxygenase
MVLSNWCRRDPEGLLALENLDTLVTFYDLEDERWFYLVTVALEARGAAAIPIMLDAQAAVARDDPAALARNLAALAEVIAAVTGVMNRMYERCRPAEFYRYVRPVLTGWPEPGVVYEGVGEGPRCLIGGSAAQSSLIQAFDAVLGVRHPSPASGPFLTAMRGYMPPLHRRFLQRLEEGPSIRGVIDARSRADFPEVHRSYRACIHELELFRKQHLGLATRYVAQPAGEDPTVRGTGGTDFGAFLNAARRETREGLGDPG